MAFEANLSYKMDLAANTTYPCIGIRSEQTYKKKISQKFRVLRVTIKLFYSRKRGTFVLQCIDETKTSEEILLKISFYYVRTAKRLCLIGICIEVYRIVLIHKLKNI